MLVASLLQMVPPHEKGLEMKDPETQEFAVTSPPEGIWRGNKHRASILETTKTLGGLGVTFFITIASP
jgi:hypothetical protein